MKSPIHINLLRRLFLVFGILAMAAGPAVFGQAPAPAKTAKAEAVVDINSADLKTLETLPGVGPATAQKIIENRPYRSIADLGRIKEMTELKLNALKDHISFGQSTAQTQTPPTKPGQVTDSGGSVKKEKSTKAPTARSSAKVGAGERININTANVTELDKLPGIGPAKAQAIIDYRTQNGSFKSIEDIQKVKGIKAGEFAKVKDHIKTSD